MEPRKIVIEMVGSRESRRIGEIQVSILRLVLCILIHLPINNLKMTMGLRSSMPRPRLVELSPFYHILLENYVEMCTVVFVMREGAFVLDMANPVFFRGTVHQQIFLLALIRLAFLLL